MSSNQKPFMNKTETSNADCLQRFVRRSWWTIKSYERDAIPNTGWRVEQGGKVIMMELDKDAALFLAEDHNMAIMTVAEEMLAKYKRLHSQVSGYLHGEDWEHWQKYNALAEPANDPNSATGDRGASPAKADGKA